LAIAFALYLGIHFGHKKVQTLCGSPSQGNANIKNDKREGRTRDFWFGLIFWFAKSNAHLKI
jgi:hypothetical protein